MTVLIPDTADAAAVIERMKNLLAARRRRRVTRANFLRQWSDLRARLAWTDGYRDFIRAVAERAGGKCECGSPSCHRRGRVVHHKKPVARFPDLALVVGNGLWVSKPCHRRIDPFLKELSG